jgi:hypothetical protein
MSKILSSFCLSLVVFTFSLKAEDTFTFPEQPVEDSASLEMLPALSLPEQSTSSLPSYATQIPEATPIEPFTGKINKKTVNLRLKADIKSSIVQTLKKEDLLVVTGQKGEFYEVKPPSDFKVYVYRIFVMDGKIQGDRVNVRLKPSKDAPVVGHLMMNEEVEGEICPTNDKWLVLSPPPSVRLYVSKDLVDRLGGPEVKEKFDQKKEEGKQLLETVFLWSQTELGKSSFNDIRIEEIDRKYKEIETNFSDIPAYVEKAKEDRAHWNTLYVERRLKYLEERKTEPLAEERSDAIFAREEVNDKMRLWESIEDMLFDSWAQCNESKTREEYYQEQMLEAIPLTGIIEPYNAPVKNKPGDYILNDQGPVAYLYSSHINLQNYVGKKITVLAVTRPNNFFAFPAYFVLSVEQDSSTNGTASMGRAHPERK